jgi:hypothetical protein
VSKSWSAKENPRMDFVMSDLNYWLLGVSFLLGLLLTLVLTVHRVKPDVPVRSSAAKQERENGKET